MQEKVISGSDLEKALTSGALADSGTELIGMVKSSENPKHINFTRSDCGSWVELPTEMIEKAEQLGKSTCKDHSHPIFKITLKETKSPEAKILSALLTQPLTPPASHLPMRAEPGSFPQVYPEIPVQNSFGSAFSDMNLGGGNSNPIVSLLQNLSRISGGGSGRGLGFSCGAETGCRCDGVMDCLYMIGKNVCRGKLKCYTGWVTGEVVCTCDG